MSLRERIAAMIAEAVSGFQETADATPDECLELADEVIAQVNRETTVSVDDEGRQVLKGMATVIMKGKVNFAECLQRFDMSEPAARSLGPIAINERE